MRFWDMALREYAKYAKNDYYQDALSIFFKNVDYNSKKKSSKLIQVGDGTN